MSVISIKTFRKLALPLWTIWYLMIPCSTADPSPSAHRLGWTYYPASPNQQFRNDSYRQGGHLEEKSPSFLNPAASYSSPVSLGWPPFGNQQSQQKVHHEERHIHHVVGGEGWTGGGEAAGGHHNSALVDHNKGHDFRSYFDIALTALAFLSFGIFLLNLLLNSLLYAGLLTTTGGTSTGRRGKRQVAGDNLELFLDPVTSMDALALNVLGGIEALLHRQQCLEKSLCDGNREARIIASNFQYFMPLYSVSMSFLSRKLGFHDRLFSHCEAIVNGLLEVNCQEIYGRPECAPSSSTESWASPEASSDLNCRA